VIKIVEPGADHLVSIANLTEKEIVYAALEQWLEIQIDRSTPVTRFDTDDLRIDRSEYIFH
jgi:hypothetical protein